MKLLSNLAAYALLSSALMSNLSFAESAPTASSKTNFDINKLSLGFGFSHNRIDQSSLVGQDLKASGYQLFAGYDLGNKKGFDLFAEAGLIKTKDLSQTNEDLDGIWAAAVVKKDLPEINNKLSALVRIGYGINGDDGLLMGLGAQLKIMPQAFLRLEYLNKDLSQSYQVNAVYTF